MAGHRAVTLDVAYAFGSRCGSGLRDAAAFGDDAGQHLVYPAGRYVMFRHVDSAEATFIISDDKVEAVTACAVSRDRNFLAVCEKRSSSPLRRIAAYDLRVSLGSNLVRTLEPVGPSSTARLVGVSFSADGQLLVAISVGSEALAIVLDWRQDGRVVARCRLDQAPDRVAFSPELGQRGDPVAAHVSVSGPRFLRVMQLRDYPSKIRDSSLKLMPPFSGFDDARITDHAWVEPGDGGLLVCATQAGSVYILNSQDLGIVRCIETPFGKFTGKLIIPLSVRCFSQGFIIGGGEGMLAVWEKVEDDDPEDDDADGVVKHQEFKHAGTVRIQHAGKPDTICSVDMTSGDDCLLIGFQNSNIAVVQIMALYQSKTGVIECNALSGGFHSGPITGLDMAVQRPLVVSMCAADSSVRVWNYITRQCEIMWSSSGEAPTGVALHPFGYFLAVSFSDKICFFYVLDTALQRHSEFAVHGVKLLRFANGGHLLAAAQGKMVHVFSTRSLSKVATLQGHAHHVISLCFDPEDHSLWTCDHDGSLCQWNVQGWEKVDEHASPDSQYTAASSSSPSAVCCSAVRGEESCLRRFSGCALEHEQVLPGSAKLTAICTYAGSNVVIAGTALGTLRVCASSTAADKVRDFVVHAGPCNTMLLSGDGRTLVTGGEDGAIFMLNVAGLAHGDSAPEHLGDLESRMVGADVVLINRAVFLERQETCERLRAENSALKARIVAEAAALEEECTRKVEEARVKDTAEIQELERRCAALEQAYAAKERESQRITKSMEETHSQAYHQLERLYDKKIEHEEDRHAALELRRAELLEEIERTRAETEQQMQRDQERADEELVRVMAEKDLEIQKHKDLIAFTQHRFDSMLQAVGEEHDEEVAEMKLRSHAILEEQKQIEGKLRKEQNTLQKGLDLMNQEKLRLEREQQDASLVIRSMKEQTEDFTRTLNSLKVENKEREQALHEKEQKIESYKLKVSKLKKLKHMLNQQLQEVTESLQPKEQLIGQMKRTLQELEAEFELQLTEQRAMESKILQKSQHLQILASESKQLQDSIKEKDRFIIHYTNDLHTLITEQPDERLWPQEIRRLYHTHVCGLCPYEEQMPVEKMQLQMRQAERRVSALSVKGSQQKAMRKADIQRKANENALLVHDVNELRIQTKSLQTNIKLLTSKLQELDAREEAPPPALEDVTRRPRSRELAAPGLAATAPAAPGRSASSGSLPRTPSGGRPGPRQSSSRGFDLAREPGPARTRSVPPLAKGKKPHVSQEDQNRIHSVLSTAELNKTQLHIQKTENSLLREQIDVLMQAQRHAAPAQSASKSRPKRPSREG